MAKKLDKRTLIEKAVDRFSQALALRRPKSALNIVEAYFAKFPSDSISPYNVALKHHENYRNAEFAEQLLSAVERGRNNVSKASSLDKCSVNEQGE